MSVKLRQKQNKDGTTSLLLDIYHSGKRTYQFLPELKLMKPRNKADQKTIKDNRGKLELAERIAQKKSLELAASDYDMTTDIGKKTIVTEWMQSYVDRYTKKDVRNMQGALNRFKAFLKDDGKAGLTFGRLTKVIVYDFQDYLLARSQGEGARSYFTRFKKMVARAKSENLIAVNPALEVRMKKSQARKKDFLTIEEIQAIANTATEATEVKRAFLFACMTGLRWIDIAGLRWYNYDHTSGVLSLTQEKTGEDVTLAINSTAKALLGEPGEQAAKIFDLPTHDGANKSIKAIVRRAGINKKITFHNARHSYGTNLAYHGHDVLTIASLMGHTSTKHTQRYLRASEELKRKAADSLTIKL
jgi:integrase